MFTYGAAFNFDLSQKSLPNSQTKGSARKINLLNKYAVLNVANIGNFINFVLNNKYNYGR